MAFSNIHNSENLNSYQRYRLQQEANGENLASGNVQSSFILEKIQQLQNGQNPSSNSNDVATSLNNSQQQTTTNQDQTQSLPLQTNNAFNFDPITAQKYVDLFAQQVIYDPRSFRNPEFRDAQYSCTLSTTTDPVFSSQKLLSLGFYVNIYPHGFYPWQVDQNHPIWVELLKLCDSLLEQSKNSSLEERIALFEKAIKEMVCSSKGIAYSPLEQAELVDIAARYYLLSQLSVNENFFYELKKNPPINLMEGENILYDFVSKNGIYVIHVIENTDFFQKYLNAFDHKNNQTTIGDPRSFRNPEYQHAEYSRPLLTTTDPVFHPQALEDLSLYARICPRGFYPWQVDQNHPIWVELLKLCNGLLERSNNLPLQERIALLERGITGMVSSIVHPERKELKELIDIAARYYLLSGLLADEKTKIEAFYQLHEKLPLNLAEIEDFLYWFVSNNTFYDFSNISSFLVQGLVSSIRLPPILTHITINSTKSNEIETSETLISDALSHLQLSTPSCCARAFEETFRWDITQKLITAFATYYNEQFQKTGTFSLTEMQRVGVQLDNLLNKNRQPPIDSNSYLQLITKIFEVDDALFASARMKVLAKEREMTALATSMSQEKPFSLSKLFSNAPTLKQQIKTIRALAKKQMETIDQAEIEHRKILQPPPFSNIQIFEDYQQFSPPLSEEAIPSLPIIEELTTPPIIEESPSQTIMQATTTTSPVIQTPVMPTVTFIPEAPHMETRTLPTTQTTTTTPPVIQTPVMSTVTFIPEAPHMETRTLPVISYVHIAFSNLFNRGESDSQVWSALPENVKKDVLRHAWYQPHCKGKAEELAKRVFEKTLLDKLNEFSNKRMSPVDTTRLSQEFVTKGMNLIDLYYSDKLIGKFHMFIEEFQQLPNEPIFHGYVYEMAKAAGVQIESWDREWAKYHWKDPKYVHLGVQALERALHTSR